jgi:hypothetical protein
MNKKLSFNGIGWDARSCLVHRDESCQACLSVVAMNPSL